MPEPTIPLAAPTLETKPFDIPVEGEVSATEAELNAKIDEELGLPPVPKQPTNEENPDEKNPDIPDEPSSDPGGQPEEETPDEADTPAENEEDLDEEAPAAEPATPSDAELFIEVEDAEGVTHKISKIEDLPEDFQLKNNRQGLEIMRELDKLDKQIETREADAAIAAEEAELKAVQKEQFNSWDKEVTELAKQKRVDVKDTERLDAVFAYMNEINTARSKAGNNNFVTSFEDALDKLEAKEAKDAANDKDKQEIERAKLKSGLIGRSSAPKGDHYVYRAGSARNIDDVPI